MAEVRINRDTADRHRYSAVVEFTSDYVLPDNVAESAVRRAIANDSKFVVHSLDEVEQRSNNE